MNRLFACLSGHRLHLQAAALALLFFVSASFGSAQSVLQSAGDFVLLAGTAVTVAGPGPDVFSNGNVGAANAIDGFPPATIVN